MSIASHITAITSQDWTMLARECTHRASWQVSENSSNRLFGMASMFTRLAAKQGISQRTPKRRGTIRSWRAE